jgi:hypothetical protein
MAACICYLIAKDVLRILEKDQMWRKKMSRYYLTRRGPGPGAIPQIWDNRAINVVDFGAKLWVKKLNCLAWGYVEYTKTLTKKQIDAYELMEV